MIAEQTQAVHFEPRWPVAVSIVSLVLLLRLLPGRISMLPLWFGPVLGTLVLAPIAAVALTHAKPRWLRVERTAILLFFGIVVTLALLNLGALIQEMVYRSAQIDGLQLLESSIAVWVANVVVFSLLYWQIDRGGPECRVNRGGVRPDWLFPQDGAPAPDVRPGWTATYPDYLYLGYETATAFSTTDAMPLTCRAKMLMMLQSAISLTTLVVVAARSINILGS